MVMMLFGLLGLAALVVDLGFARLTQTQMQTAVDSAALERLRNGPAQASQIVSEMFSNSLDSSGQTVQYGAGPVVDFSGGVGPSNLAAGQLMQPGVPPVYQPPGLQPNESNAAEGDMVAGAYGFNPAYDSALSADEDANYNRRDFTPSGGTAATAFLVRMHRTNNVTGLDQEAGISSAGPPLPFLFGRGSLLALSGSGSQLSVSSGIIVRATAIAGPQPAKTVGPLYTNTGGSLTAVPQLAPFAITAGLWTQVLSGGSATTAVTLPDPRVLLLAPTFSASLTAIGQPLATTSDNSVLAGGSRVAVYVPIYADYPSQPATIIGFVYVNWSYQGGSLTLGPAAGAVQIGGQNVSPTMALPLPAVLAPADATAMFQDHAALFSQNPLYAPALVNRYLGPGP